MTSFKWPLMQNNFHGNDFEAIGNLLTGYETDWDLNTRLTQGEQVKAFEEEFAAWQGRKHAIFVNSGSSANLLTMAALREVYKSPSTVAEMGAMFCGEYKGRPNKVLVPCITWASDATSILHAGFEPVFVDVDRQTLGMDNSAAIGAIETGNPAAVFLTHCFGYNALGTELQASLLRRPQMPLFEDCCESIGARTRWAGRKHKVGCFGLASNYSFYYAHHMTTVEGGMVCTDDFDFAEVVRCLRGHGLARERQSSVQRPLPDDLDPQFVFLMAGYNCRSTEINAVIGRSQLKRLDEGIAKRRELAKLFYSLLDPEHYETGYDHETASPYGLVIQLKHADKTLRDAVAKFFAEQGVETRRGVAGGGNQMRQPYLRRRYGTSYAQYPNAEHLHFYGFAIGLWPGLPDEDVKRLAEGLNKLVPSKV